jgi:UDP-glucose 4-epimerase
VKHAVPMEKIWLITGGAGYIGSEISAILRENNTKFLVLDDLSTGSLERVRGENFIKGDIKDQDIVDELFSKYRFHGVIHLAAKKDVGEAELQPELYFANNVDGTKNLHRAAHENGVSRFIFASTAAVYDTTFDLPSDGFSESSAVGNNSIYGATKLECEKILLENSEKSLMKTVLLRFFNVAGTTSNTGWDFKSNNLIPKIFEALDSGKPFEIYGNDYPTDDGTGIRDYLHVSDLSKLMWKCMTEALPATPLILNAGRGSGYSVLEVIKEVESVTSLQVKINVSERRQGDSAIVFADSKKAKQLFDWKCNYDLTDILRNSWEQYSNFKGRNSP